LTLTERYRNRRGTASEPAYLQAGPRFSARLAPPLLRADEIEFIARNERVLHLDDISSARTLVGLLGEATRPVIEEAWPPSSPPSSTGRPRPPPPRSHAPSSLLQTVHGMTFNE